jgi:hypothetical protein
MGTWTSSDAQPLTPALVSDLLAGNVYFEIATQEFPGGPAEIRAQLTVLQSTAVPEPTTLTLLATGALGLLGYGWRKRKQPHP